uniref:Aminotransferase-like plant mobile domain-containing protein n=1 Tax=Ananas comosus var. bracteatus TaxID=296719 RepID=A0A6V7P4T1_ANACO|nr:unnamed protein product [Ananas comosus var. bracteatus]
MAPLPPLSSSSSLDYNLLRQFVSLDPSQFILGSSFTDDPIPEDFPFLSEELLTPTLLDVAAIIGLHPHGITLSIAYNPNGVVDFEAHLDITDLAYTKFIRKFAGHYPAAVTKKEHIAFLLYWLCHNLFCTRSQKINRDFVPIANGERLA